jgi:hypothetical protein
MIASLYDGSKEKISLLKSSRSRASIPAGPMRNNWNTNLTSATMTIIAIIIIIM